MSSQINIKNLSFGFNEDCLIFDNLSLSIPSASFSLLVGPSGTGKSTFLKLLAKIYPSDRSQTFQGTIDSLPQKWGMIFQNPDTQFTMATPREEFIFTLENLKLDQTEADKRFKAAVTQTHLESLLDQKLTTLSGGEKQRVAFALMLAMRPSLLLLDEPFANCDPANREFLIKQLAQLKQNKTTIILSDHDLSHYKNLVDQIYYCDNQKINRVNSPNALFTSPQAFHLKVGSSPAKPLFKFKNFSLVNQNKSLIHPTALNLYSGATLLTGVNGSGKTTFFNALTKMISYKGEILFKEKNILKIKNKTYLTQVGQVFQNPNNQFLMVTVGEEIEFSLKHCHNSLLQNKTITELLTLIDLTNHQDQIVYSLSGGQKKKLQVLLMLMANPLFLLLDEPFAGVDQAGQRQIINLLDHFYLEESSEKGLLLISHQLQNSDNFFDHHLLIQDQQLFYSKE